MSGIIDLFIPREKKFFKYLDEQVLLLDDCIKHLDKYLKNKRYSERQIQKNLEYIQEKSDEADAISREIINLLHQTFITPIDREEIKSLSVSINLIVDSIEKIANGVFYFKLKKLDQYFLKQLKILREAVELLKLIFEDPLSSKRNRIHIGKIKSLEREGDITFRKAIGYLFTNGHSPIEIIKQKEIYEITEDAIDDAKTIADILETVLINNS